MPEYGEIVPIPDHRLDIDYDRDTWSCACGTGGQGNSDRDAGELAVQHREEQLEALVPTLAPSQFADALRLGAADDSSRMAAVELLIHHDHWIGYGYLRRIQFIGGGWKPDGNLYLQLEWSNITAAIGHPRELVEALDGLDAPYDVVKRLKEWAENATEPAGRIHGSTSELAILKVACSIAGWMPVHLGSGLSNLGNTNRGLVITAVSHLLSHGGNLPMRAAMTWQSYDNA